MPKICRPNNGTLINADFNANKSTFDIKFGGSKSNFDLNLNKNIEVIISHLRAELVPRRLQEFITINEESLTNNSYIYIDNYGEDAKFDIRELNKYCDELEHLAQKRSRPSLIEDHDIDALVYAGTRFNL